MADVFLPPSRVWTTDFASNNLFNFLNKYDIEVISLDPDNEITERIVNQVKTLASEGTIKYIYVPQHEELSEELNKIVEEAKLEIIYFHTLENITETERTSKEDYITIMNANIDLLKEELYN